MQTYNTEGIRLLFSVVPKTYEVINHILTFGLDTRWRNRAVAIACREPASRILDCCSGTGEFAAAIDRRFQSQSLIVAGDFSSEMIHFLKHKRVSANLKCVLMSAEHLPFTDNTLDLVSISFGVRNINRSNVAFRQCLEELVRILRPGGRCILVETSQPDSGFIRMLFHFYTRLFVERIGYLLSGSKAPYTYLSRTIPAFYNRNQLSSILESAGFRRVRSYPLTLGIACIHEAKKPNPDFRKV